MLKTYKKHIIWLLCLIGIMTIGWFSGIIFKETSGQVAAPPQYIISLLLAIGLYAAATGIDINEAKKDYKLILSAISIGVIAKTLIIGALLWLVFNDPVWLLLGVVVAQIDPLSVATLRNSTHMSSRAKHVLSSWATFDDPITVLLAIYILPFIIVLFGGSSSLLQVSDGSGNYLSSLLINLATFGATLAIWKFIKNQNKKLQWMLLIIALVAAVFFNAMLAIAAIGLFLRPANEKFIDKTMIYIYSLATLLIGVLLAGGINFYAGVILGITTYGTHYLVSNVLTKIQRLPAKDRLHIGLGQQNGVTAINLALLFAVYIPSITSIVAPAIVIINLLNLVCNMLAQKISFRMSVKGQVEA